MRDFPAELTPAEQHVADLLGEIAPDRFGAVIDEALSRPHPLAAIRDRTVPSEPSPWEEALIRWTTALGKLRSGTVLSEAVSRQLLADAVGDALAEAAGEE